MTVNAEDEMKRDECLPTWFRAARAASIWSGVGAMVIFGAKLVGIAFA